MAARVRHHSDTHVEEEPNGVAHADASNEPSAPLAGPAAAPPRDGHSVAGRALLLRDNSQEFARDPRRRRRRGDAPERLSRHQLGAPFTAILTAVTLFTGPVMNKILSFRPANVLLVAPLPVGILRMLLPSGSKAITPCPLLI